jgi:hypothetical protein
MEPRKSANFLSSYRQSNIFNQLNESDKRLNLAPGQYSIAKSMLKRDFGNKTNFSATSERTTTTN